MTEITKTLVGDYLPPELRFPGVVDVPCADCGKIISMAPSSQEEMGPNTEVVCMACLRKRPIGDIEVPEDTWREIEAKVGRHLNPKERRELTKLASRRVWGDA